jgi:hypothetical protein
VKRTLRVEQLTAPCHPVNEQPVWKEALGDAEAAGALFGAVFELLGAPTPGKARFEKLFAATASLALPPSVRWPVATLLPFLAQPERHVFLRPKPAREAAERLGCDLRYDDAPNWATYSALRAFSAQWLEALSPKGARDFVDVEVFLHATAAQRHPAKPVKQRTPARRTGAVARAPRTASRVAP